MEQQFKTVHEFIAYLEGIEGDALNKQYVVDNLKALTTRPASGQRRGQLAGLTLEEMTDEQLKREIINSKSVLYKAQQRNADPATIEKNQARVDAALAEKAKRDAAKGPAPAAATAEGEVYSEGVAAEL